MKLGAVTLALAAFTLSGSLASGYEGLSAAIRLLPISAKDSAIRIQSGGEFTSAANLDVDDPYLFLFENPAATIKPTQLIYHGRAAYSAPIPITKLNEAFFKSAARVQRLLGPQVKVQILDTNPFTFTSVAQAVGPLTIKSTQIMHVVNGNRLASIPGLERAVSQLNRRSTAPSRVILQRASGFNMTVRQAFMVTLLYEVDATRTDIEVVSAVLIDSNALGKGLIKKSSTKNLIEYANRLAQEKP